MFNLKIVLWLTIVSSSLFVNCNGNRDTFGALRNVFSTRFDDFVEFFDQQKENAFKDRHSNVEDNYDDAKCFEQMGILMNSFNKSETWALKGKPKPNVCKSISSELI